MSQQLRMQILDLNPSLPPVHSQVTKLVIKLLVPPLQHYKKLEARLVSGLWECVENKSSAVIRTDLGEWCVLHVY